jgi:hypothetical protein
MSSPSNPASTCAYSRTHAFGCACGETAFITLEIHEYTTLWGWIELRSNMSKDCVVRVLQIDFSDADQRADAIESAVSVEQRTLSEYCEAAECTVDTNGGRRDSLGGAT